MNRRLLARLSAVIVAAVVLAAAVGGDPSPTGAQASGPVFSDDFETGDLRRWTQVSGMVVQPLEVFSGAYAARGTSTGSTTTGTYARVALATAQADLAYRVRFKLVSQGPNYVSLLKFRTATGSILTVFVSPPSVTGGRGELALNNDVTRVLTYSSVPVLPGWHELQVRLRVGSPGGKVEVWYDGAQVGALSKTDDFGATPIGVLQLGENTRALAYDLVFDEVTADTVPITPPPAAATETPSPTSTRSSTPTPSPTPSGTPTPTTTGTVTPAPTGTPTATPTGTSTPTPTRTPTPSPPAGRAPVVVAVGDIACDPTSAYFYGGQGTTPNCGQSRTSELALARDPAAVLPLGDVQYEQGTLAQFMASYDPSWGRLKTVTRPAVGNHEYLTAGAAGYFDYFNGAGAHGGPAGDRDKGYYAFDVGTWRLYAVNSNCSKVGGCGVGSAQERWLRADLAANPRPCGVLAYWHHPRFSSGQHGSFASMGPIYQALHDFGAEVVLAGHDHDYERFEPLLPSGAAHPNAVRPFVVGSGGRNHIGLGAPIAGSVVRNADAFGVLALMLRADGYDWEFVPEPGKEFRDSGSATCR